MPTIRFLRDHEDRRTATYAKNYKAGTAALVHRSCAERALAAGDAVLVRERFEPRLTPPPHKEPRK